MKRYKRKTPLLSPLKIVIAALCAAITTAIVFIFAGTDNYLFVLCVTITFILFLCYLFIKIGASSKYRYTDKYVQILFMSLPIRKLYYSKYSYIVISSASYDYCGYGDQWRYNFPMQYKVKGKNGNINVTFPYITLHKPRYPVDMIKSGMNSHILIMFDHKSIYQLGICWFDSLQELLNNTDFLVYVLEDVYLRFKGEFDLIFSEYKENLDRFYIITEHSVAYQVYREENRLENMEN